MSKLDIVDLSNKIREKISSYAFSSFTLQSVPTGRDPRRFTEDDHLPQITVNIRRTSTKPVAIGGAGEATSIIDIYMAFKYVDNDDINIKKLTFAEEIFDFLVANKNFANIYKLFITESGESVWPVFDFHPEEEDLYVMAGVNIALLRCTFGAKQVPFFNIMV